MTQAREVPVLPIIISAISAIAACLIAGKEKEISEEINSRPLIANAKESFLDIFTSIIVLGGIWLASLQIPYVEGAIIILISLLIFKLGVENTWTALLVLLDANLDSQLQLEIEKRPMRYTALKETAGSRSDNRAFLRWWNVRSIRHLHSPYARRTV